MEYQYELVRGEENLPIKTIIHGVDGCEMHWHNAIEILLVLEGSINVSIGEETHYLKENEFILINCNELHSTRRTKDDNILLAIQIDPGFYNSCYPKFSQIEFDCKSFPYEEDEQKKFDTIRQYIANMVWELNKKEQGYQLAIGSYLHLLGAYLINNFDYTIVGDENEKLRDEDLIRLQSIIDYVNKNINRKITLKEVAENEHLSYYYLSHFIKDKMGMSFQDYLNNVRLNNGVNMLINTDETVTDISYAIGFSNVNSFYRLFKETYNCTPIEYKKQHAKMFHSHKNFINNKEANENKTYLDVDRTSALKKLFSYLDFPEEPTERVNKHKRDIEHIEADGKDKGKYLEHYWQKLTTFGRAAEGLRAKWQFQFKELQREIGFEYIRFHGIFMDEMMIYNISKEGKIEYNWSYVDELFDFFMEMNIKPFVELGFMPSELKSSEETVFWWKGNISPPKDIKLWTGLVEELIKHCINRYGIEEVETWYFEVWNEPEYEYFFWAASKEEYFEFYKNTAIAVKYISEKLKVGGPAITHGSILESNWLDDFLVFCSKNKVPLDFISVHIYPEYISLGDIDEDILYSKNMEDLSKEISKIKRIYYDRDHTFNTLNAINNKIETILDYKPEVHITEWNASSYFGNLIHDTSYVATFIIKNVLQCVDMVDSLGYWTFTDILEEHKLGISSFHGGFGLINKDGLKKPSYYAYYLLSKLGDRIITQGEDHIVTRRNQDIQILAYNYTYFDDLFLSGDTSLLTDTERYLVYEDKPTKKIEINIKELSGDYKITRYELNRENGSVFDEWMKMGSPENMTQEELKYLKGKGQPKVTVEYSTLKGAYKGRLSIPAHGVELITLKKI